MNIDDWIKTHFDANQDCIMITGASSGIGLEYLKQLSKYACTIYAVSEEAEKLDRVSSELMAKSQSIIIPIVCDFSDKDQVNIFTKKASGLNIKILINNAGIGMKGNYVEHTNEEVDYIYNVNVCTPLKLLLAILPNMLAADSGVIIQVTTVNVVTPIPLNALYTGGKTALSSTFCAIMYEYKLSGVFFQEMRPGTTDTPFHIKQQVEPASMVMQADNVVAKSLNKIDNRIFFPNITDRYLAPIIERFPVFLRMRIGLYFLKSRLGLGPD